jgi:5'-deoxynucleotidase YfbR-like HD superfamily hydrolase
MSWMQTFRGNRFNPDDPAHTKFEIEDIAHALSNLCRYGGHCKRFYSVAEHSVLVADIVAATPGATLEDEIWALMHDATEAYLTDLPTPIKARLPKYKAIEAEVAAQIQISLGLPGLARWRGDLPPIVHHADRVALVTEAAQLLNGDLTDWRQLHETRPFDAKIRCFSPEDARRVFIARWVELQERLAAKRA